MASMVHDPMLSCAAYIAWRWPRGDRPPGSARIKPRHRRTTFRVMAQGRSGWFGQVACRLLEPDHPAGVRLPSPVILQPQLHFVKSRSGETGMALRPCYREAVLAE